MKDNVIGISISNSEDAAGYGFGEEHLRDTLVEFARYLLINGFDLAYGGHLEKQGYTMYLFDLIRMYNKDEGDYKPRIKSFLSWPFSLELNNETRAKYKSEVDFHIIETVKKKIGDKSEEEKIGLKFQNHADLLSSRDKYLIAHSLLDMRMEMEKIIDARISLGGKLNSFMGFFPGILREVYLSITNGNPIFLIGAYGGCTRKIIDVIHGGSAEELSLDYQLENNEGYQSLYDELNKNSKLSKEVVNYKKVVDTIQRKGIGGLNNNLSIKENEQLFETTYLPEMIYLVLKGLKKLK